MSGHHEFTIAGSYTDGTAYSGKFAVDHDAGKVSGVFHDHAATYDSFHLIDCGASYALLASCTGKGATASLRIDCSGSPHGSDGLTVDVSCKIYSGQGCVTKHSPPGGGHCHPCYCSGTRVLTDKGPVTVENLQVGDMVVTASGVHRPVQWIGHRTSDLARHADQKAVWPVCIEAGAFGRNTPTRDLWISPSHAVKVGNVLVPIERLVNGASITQVPCDTITYWHIELESHDILLAEGLEAESYLDTGNRAAFVNGGDHLELHPDFQPRLWSETCLPIVKGGPDLAAIKANLLVHAEKLGHRWSADHDLHVDADGVRIAPTRLDDDSFAFDLPAGTSDVRLISRTWVPVLATADVEDYRTLGVCVGALTIDGMSTPLADLDDGWSYYETDSASAQRWTTGSARLPAGGRHIVLSLTAAGRYIDRAGTDLAEAA